MQEERKLVIILMGAPGAGKGTQATLLAEKLDLFYLETSKIIEQKLAQAQKGEVVEIKGQKFPISEEKRRWREGELNSLPLVTFWVKNKIREKAEQGENLVLAGSPRTIYEAERLTPLLEKLYGKQNLKVILIELSLEQSIFRNSHRRICKLMRHSILYNEQTQDLERCPLDGSELMERPFDRPQIIKKRFKEYQEKTLPVVDFFEDQGITLKRIDGEQSVAEVFEDILGAL